MVIAIIKVVTLRGDGADLLPQKVPGRDISLQDAVAVVFQHGKSLFHYSGREMEAGNFIEGHLLGLVQETGGGNGKVEARRLTQVTC